VPRACGAVADEAQPARIPAAGASDDYVNAGRYEIQIDTRRIPARASLTPMYDPKSARVRQYATL
jgi:glycine cleavage system aminomethyltransferase T